MMEPHPLKRDERTLVSVAICTWNRAALLHQTLTKMCDLRVADSVKWELLVVDNNSTDNTADVVAAFVDRLPVRRVLERNQGHSHARNRAVSEVVGDLLIWTDDDVLVDHQWLQGYVDAAQRWPEAGYFGGPIEPWFEHEPPGWIQMNMEALLAPFVALDLGLEERQFAPGQSPYGANMAFRRSAFDGRRFDPNLGLRPGSAIRNEETEYCKRLAESGFVGVWVPAARVQHFVVAERLTLPFLRDYFEGGGRTQIRIEGPDNSPRIWGIPRWLYRRYAELRIRAAWRRVTRDPFWPRPYFEAARHLGMILETRDRHRAERGGSTEHPGQRDNSR